VASVISLSQLVGRVAPRVEPLSHSAGLVGWGFGLRRQPAGIGACSSWRRPYKTCGSTVERRRWLSAHRFVTRTTTSCRCPG